MDGTPGLTVPACPPPQASRCGVPVRARLLALLFLPFCSVCVTPAPAQAPHDDTGFNAPVAHFLATGEQDEQQQQLQSAEAAYRQALMLSPASLPALTHLAAVLQQQGQLAAAINFWQEALLLTPGDAQLSASLANAYLANGNPTEAASLLQKQLTHPSANDGALWIDLGTALARLDRYEEAAKAYASAQAFPAYADLAQLSLTKALLTLNRYPLAAPHAVAYARQHPADCEANTLLGIADEGLGHLPQAEAELRLAVSQKPADFDSQYHLGAVLRAEGKTQAAIPALLRAVALRPHSQEAHFQLARAYRASHQAEPAAREEAILVSLVKATQTDTQIVVLGNQALAATISGALEQAVHLYLQILALKPDNSQASYDLALVYERRHDRTAERTLLQQAATQPDAIAGIHSQLGFLDIAEGKKEAGEQQLRLALQRDPQCVEALGNLGVLEAQSGHAQEATRLLLLSVEADPQYEQGFRNLGLVLASTGDAQRASSALQAALALQPNDPVATRALAAVAAAQLPAAPK